MSKLKKIAHVMRECVACGVCVRKCPIGAISLYKGLYATVDAEKCRGCGVCAKSCPANVIYIAEVENA